MNSNRAALEGGERAAFYGSFTGHTSRPSAKVIDSRRDWAGGAVDPHPEGSLVPRLLPVSGRAVRVTPELGSLWPVLFLVLPEYTQGGSEARQPGSGVGGEEGGQRAEPERGKGCGPFSQVLWTLVPPWFSDAMLMIDPKLLQEVCGVSPLLPPLLPSDQASPLEGPSPGVPSFPSPHCSKGSQRLVPAPPPCRPLHPAPCPCPQDPSGQPPSLCPSQRCWRQAARSFSSGLTLHRSPRTLLPLFLTHSEIDSLLAENPGGWSPALSLHQDLQPLLLSGTPSRTPSAATPHRPRQADPQRLFPSETQSPG